MAHGVLVEIVLVMAAAVLVAALLRRVALPPVAGFLIAGVLIGPAGLGLVHDRGRIEGLAEVGVMLLLFTVGLKLSLKELWRLRRAVFLGGGAQVVVTILAVGAIGIGSLGLPIRQAAVWGLLLALSSTALVITLLESGGDTARAEGRIVVAILLFQDLAVIPAIVALPLLAGTAGTAGAVLGFVGRAVGVLVLTILAARWLFPRLTARIVATGSRELFTLTTFLVAVGTALVVGEFGISMALGAFLAGMVIAESEFVGRYVDHITPVRDVLNSLFFVSMGMLLDLGPWKSHPLRMAGFVVAVILLKGVIAGGVGGMLAGRRGALMAGLGLAQIGEFSFVLAEEATRRGALDEQGFGILVGVAVVSMIATPPLVGLARRWARRVPEPKVHGLRPVSLSGHVIIVGYGVNGRNVARALRLLDVPHIVVDLNPHTVTELQSQDENALYGDARHPAVLEAVGIASARALIAAIPDAASTREVVACARKANATLTILARTRYLREVEALHEQGATEVIPEEFETSIELTGRVLELYGASHAVVEGEKAALRSGHYGTLRQRTPEPGHATVDDLLRKADLSEIVLGVGSPAEGQSLRDLALRERTGASVVAIRRAGDLMVNPPPDSKLRADDTLVVFGDAAQVAAATGSLTAQVEKEGAS